MTSLNRSLQHTPGDTNSRSWNEPPCQWPESEHQRGVGKLLGEKYPSFLREVFPQDFESFHQLDDLVVALRSYIVLDDYVFDRFLPLVEQAKVRRECNNHLAFAKQVLCNNGLPKELVEFGRTIIEQAKTHFNFTAPIHSVLEKCWYVLLPIELVSDANEMKEPTRKFVCEYLTLLQLFDDFQDVAEDSQGPTNHNVYVSNECLGSIPVLQLQVALMPSLTSYGQHLVSRWCGIASTSITASGFITYAKNYLNMIDIETRDIQAPANLFDLDCVRTGRLFARNGDLDRLRTTSLAIKHAVKWKEIISLIRAELIHRTSNVVKEGDHA